MKQRVTNRPPFGIELRFERTEIDLMCVEELEKAEALPATPGPINIESFIGKHLCRDYGYEDLPDGVLGVTAFEPNGAIKFVGVSSKLDDHSPSAEHRIRSTWAHEAGTVESDDLREAGHAVSNSPSDRNQPLGECAGLLTRLVSNVTVTLLNLFQRITLNGLPRSDRTHEPSEPPCELHDSLWNMPFIPLQQRDIASINAQGSGELPLSHPHGSPD